MRKRRKYVTNSYAVTRIIEVSDITQRRISLFPNFSDLKTFLNLTMYIFIMVHKFLNEFKVF